MCAHEYRNLNRPETDALGILKLELQAVVSCLIQVLDTKPRSPSKG